MGCLLIILIVATVSQHVILPAIADLPHHEQIQIKGAKSNDHQYARSHSYFSDPFQIVNNSLPFNKYAFLTTHNSLAWRGSSFGPKGIQFPADHIKDTKDSVTRQLNSGVRALMLFAYNQSDEVQLCHQCDQPNNYLRFSSPAHYLFQEVEEFLTSNPSEIVTLILKDEVETPNGLAKIFNGTGLTKYMLPLTKMPRHGGDWPPVKDIVAANQRLVVFSSAKTKEESEGIAYQGNFVVEYKYGNHQGTDKWNCTERKDLSPLQKKSSKSLVLLNYYSNTPGFTRYSKNNSKDLMNAIRQCHPIGSDHWANFIAVDYAEGVDDVGPAFEAVNFLNGKLLCGCDDVNSCQGGSWCPSEAEFGNSHSGGQPTSTINTKVITPGYLSCIVFFITCIILKYASRVVRYLKKNKYKLKR